MTMTADPVAVAAGPAGLTVPLSDGPAYFNYHWLRDNCASAIDPETRERVFDITERDTPPVAAEAWLEDGELVVVWADEAGQSRYALGFLESFRALGRRPDPAALPRRLWRAGQHPHFARVDAAAVDADPAARARLARALIEDGIAVVEGMEETDAALDRLAQALGPITPTVDGHHFDVRLEIAPVNLAFTANALEMHTDLPNEEAAPGVQFLHCRRNTVEGGNSLFLDGAAVAEEFRETHPEDFEILATHAVPFYRSHEAFDYRAHQRVIELDRDGSVSGLTISQHLADAFDLPQEVLDRYYPAFCRFVRMLKEERFLNRFRLNAGECIVFDNHRVVHGREAFSATSGERHLRGCYVDRGALRSTYRVLAKAGHDRAA